MVRCPRRATVTMAVLALSALTVFATTVPALADTGRLIGEYDPWSGGRADVSPDGSWVVYDAGADGLQAVDVATGDSITLGGPCSSFFEEQACDWRFTPDGDIVWLDRGVGTLTLTSLPGGDRFVLAESIPTGPQVFAEIRDTSPAGVVYTVADWNSEEVSLYHASFDDTAATLVASGSYGGPSGFSYTVLLDGAVVFVDSDWHHFDPVSGVTSVFDPGPDAPDGHVGLALVPGGGRVIAFGDTSIVSVPLDGSSATVLSNVAGEHEWSAFTPDGSRVVYGTRREPELNSISVAAVDGSSAAEVIVEDAPFNTSWAVSDAEVIYVIDHDLRKEGPGLYATALDGSATRHLTSGYAGATVSNFLLSEDGAQVAAVLDDAGTARLVTLDIGNGSTVGEFSGDILGPLHLSSNTVLFTLRIDGRLHVIAAPRTGGVLTSLTRAPAHWEGWSVRVLSADSDTLVWSELTYQPDAVARIFAASDRAPSTAALPPGGTFTDDDMSFHRGWIEAIAVAGVTAGCEPDRYCPSDPITREQMATFLARAFNLSPFNDHGFSDVTAANVHSSSIGAVAAAGISVGCNSDGTRFCPKDVVTRQQMASFLARALALDPGTSDFLDIEPTNVHAPAIAAIADAQITAGCQEGVLAPPSFCPEDRLTREQMAAFLGRALRLNPLFPST